MFAAVVRSLRCASLTKAARAAKPIRRPRLGMECLEGRDVPSRLVWVNGANNDTNPAHYAGNGQFSNAWNWNLIPGTGSEPGNRYGFGARTPTAGDDLDFNLVTGDCYGFAGGTYRTVNLIAPGLTVHLSGPVTTGQLNQSDGAFDLTDATPLTVVGTLASGGRFAKSWTWTGGTLDNTPGAPSNFLLTGPNTTGLVDPPGTGVNALTLNANLTVDNKAKLDFADGGVVSAYDTSVLVTGGASASAASLQLLVTALAVQGKVKVSGADSVFVFTNTTSTRALEVAGGKVFIAGNGKTTKFMPPVAEGKPSVLMTDGALVIDNGATLDAGGSEVHITGGQLATRAVAQGDQPTATITTPKLIVQADTALVGIDISDTAYNATGDNKHYFGHLRITGDISWIGGAYRPVVDGTVNGANESKFADLWSCGGTFYTDGANASLVPEDVNRPAGGYRVGREWKILHSDVQMTSSEFGKPAVAGVDSDDWLLNGVNNKDWYLRRLTQ